MPGLVNGEGEGDEPQFKTIEVKKLHPTFAAEVSGVNFADVSDEQFSEILGAMAKYGVCVFRDTGLTDAAHVAFSRRLGDLDTIERYLAGSGRPPRYGHYELFDAGNVELAPKNDDDDDDDDGDDDDDNGGGGGGVVGGAGVKTQETEKKEPRLVMLDPTSTRAHANRGNGLFHADSSFNPRRASFSLLRAARLPPAGAGAGVGETTLFADSRTAAEELDERTRDLLLGGSSDDGGGGGGGGSGGGLVGAHSMAHSRKLGSPAFFAHLDPARWPMARHDVLQRHGPSGRPNLYVGAHLHHIEHAITTITTTTTTTTTADEEEGEREGKEIADSWELVRRLNAHATQDRYVVAVRWRRPGDLVIWDNRAVLHRAGPGAFDGRFVRDLRRTTVHDDSPSAWGRNPVGAPFPVFLSTPPPPPVAITSVGSGKDGDAR